MKRSANKVSKINSHACKKAIIEKYPHVKYNNLKEGIEQKIINRILRVFKHEEEEFYVTEEGGKIIEVISKEDFQRSKVTEHQRVLMDFNKGKYTTEVTLLACPACKTPVRPVFNTKTKENDYLCTGCYKSWDKNGKQLLP